MKKFLFITLFLTQNALFSLDIIGNIATVELIEFNNSKIEAKVDTGAYYCAIHCSSIEKVDEDIVEFSPLDMNKKFTKKIQKVTNIKSSNGQIERRFIVDLSLKLYEKVYILGCSLTNRENMNYKMLLGSEFIKGRFLVDVSK